MTQAGTVGMAEGNTANPATVSSAADLAQIPLRPHKIAATDAPAITRALNAYAGALLGGGVVATSGLSTIFSAVASQEHQMAETTAVISLELVLLALIVLYGVASSNSDERSSDLAIAELRGLSRSSIALLALREPAVLLALSAPAGLLIGWTLVTLAGTHVFPRVPVQGGLPHARRRPRDLCRRLRRDRHRSPSGGQSPGIDGRAGPGLEGAAGCPCRPHG